MGGRPLRGLSHADIVASLSGPGPVHLTLLPCLVPLDFFDHDEPELAAGEDEGCVEDAEAVGQDAQPAAARANEKAASGASSPQSQGSPQGSPSPAGVSPASSLNARPNASNSPGQEQPGGAPRTVVLHRGPHGFGLSLATDSAVVGLIVAQVAKGSAAAASQQIYVGDVILAINDMSTAGMTRDDAVAIFSVEDEVALRVVSGRVIIRTPEDEAPLPFALRTLSLRRNERGLGLHLMQDMSGEVRAGFGFGFGFGFGSG